MSLDTKMDRLMILDNKLMEFQEVALVALAVCNVNKKFVTLQKLALVTLTVCKMGKVRLLTKVTKGGSSHCFRRGSNL